VFSKFVFGNFCPFNALFNGPYLNPLVS
jgi:hypothetical protein